ncbi:MAG: glycosyltransferase [Planctomycetia bacterium]|nr:glycosyltransferase [Planctomycetia bacterium]
MQTIDLVVVACLAGTGLLAFYGAVLYPALLALAARRWRRPWVKAAIQPRVSVIIPARNEAAIIARKLDNVLASDYPGGALEIIVASDCSSDETDSIAGLYAPRVRVLRADVRSGKQVCLNLAAAHATGEILLFTDAASLIAPNAISLLVRHFADPSIGAVSSAIRVSSRTPTSLNSAIVERAADPADALPNPSAAEGMYLGADCAVRVREGEISNIVGCVGACYAIRRSCFDPLHPGDCDDFAAVCNVVAHGKRAVMDPQVICEMLPARDGKIELARKVRTMAGAVDTLWRYRRQILKFAPPSLLWFLVSHKVCRWLLPLSILASAAAVTTGAVCGHWLWKVPLAGVLFVASAGLAGYRSSPALSRARILKHVSFLAISLSAGVYAWITVLSGKKQIVWQPTPRTAAKTC